MLSLPAEATLETGVVAPVPTPGPYELLRRDAVPFLNGGDPRRESGGEFASIEMTDQTVTKPSFWF